MGRRPLRSCELRSPSLVTRWGGVERLPTYPPDARHDVGVLLDKIAVTPGIGHTREDLMRLDLHFVRTGPYMIAYRADARPIEIVRILHGSRNLAVILGLLEP